MAVKNLQVGDRVKIDIKLSNYSNKAITKNDKNHFDGHEGVITSLEPNKVEGVDTNGMLSVKMDFFSAYGYIVNFYPSDLTKI